MDASCDDVARSACAAMVANDRTAGTAYGHGGEGPLESRSASNAGKAV